MCLSVCLSVYLSVWLSICLSGWLSVCLLIYFMRVNCNRYFSCFSFIIITGNITFYRRSSSLVGQSPLTSNDQFDSAYTLRNTIEIGSCGFPISYQEGVYPFNISGHHIREIVPTSSPIKKSHSPSPSVIIANDEKKVYNYECLKTCPVYPGLNSLKVMNRQACDFLNTEIFSVCSSYSIINALCQIPLCASSCEINDYCFFGANAATICFSRREYHSILLTFL